MWFPAMIFDIVNIFFKEEGLDMLMQSSKLNEFRLWGLLLTLAGMGLMILGTSGMVLWGTGGRILIYISLILGMILMLGSMAIYFWAGVLSTSAVVLECPKCNKQTKILGKTDRCMYCKTMLSLDPKYAPESSEDSKEQ